MTTATDAQYARAVMACLTACAKWWADNPDATALLGRGQMSSGQPALMLVIQVDGKHVLVKTSLQMMETICSTMRAACGLPRGP